MSLARLGHPRTADCFSVLFLQDLEVLCRLLEIEDPPKEDDPLRYLDPRAALPELFMHFTYFHLTILTLYLLSSFKS
jgi:hypothetical protein